MNKIRRYPGSRPFTDSPVERMLFRGRDQEKSDLLNLILAHDLILLYARSGTGKTSLLNAGILEELRIREFFPVIVRLNSEKPLENMRQTILAEAAELGIQIEEVDKSSQNLVLLLSKTRFWRGDILLTPVLILDQFEELFTLHEKAAQENIIKALSDLSARRLPDKLEENTATVPTVPFKIVFSVREDYLGEMESVASYIPTIMHHRFRLTPLSREQALKAIREPAAMEIDELCVTAFEYSNEATEELISFLSRQMDRQGYKQGEDIEPFQLQIICQHIEDEVAKRAYEEEGQIVINKNDLGGKEGMDQILEQFYNNQMGQLPLESQEVAHYLCEYGLISPSGKRISLEEEYIGDVYRVDPLTLQKLVELRLIRAEPRVGSTYYELSHDAIVAAIQRTGSERKPALLLQNARASWDTANYFSAYSYYRDLIKCSPNDAVAYSECATMLIDVGRYEEADIVLKEAVKAGVLTEEIHLVLGKLYNAQTDFKAAIEQFQEVLKLNVNSARAHLGMGLAYFNDYNDPDAAKCFQKALELEPNMQEAHEYFLKAMINMRQFDKVEEFVKNICQKEFFKNILPELSQELFAQNASRIAENILRDVLDQNKNSCDLAATIADAAYAIRDWVTTDLALKVVARFDPERPNYNIWADALQSQGHFSDAEQKYNIAEEKYTIALQNNPNDFFYLLYRAWSRFNLKKYEQAIDDCKKAAEIKKGSKKDSELPFKYWGRCLYEQGQFHEAIQQFEKALIMKPGDSELLILWAAGLNDLGSFDKAIEKAHEAIKADQTNADAFYELGRSLWLTNRLAEANERFQTAHELDPNRTDILS